MKKVISTNNAPKAIGPYSQAIEANGFVFISGQIPVNPDTGDVINGGIREQTKQVIENIKSVLEAAGSDLTEVVKTTCFLKSIDDFTDMNEVYSHFFIKNPPARAAVEVSRLPRGVLIEIEAVAYKEKSS